METLALAQGVAAAVVAHAQAGYPQEVCGLIAGRDGRGWQAYPGRNVSPTPQIAFELDVATLALQMAFEDQGLSLAAIYHSHPHGPAQPSAVDIAQALYPQAVQIICSLACFERPVLRAFRIREGQVWEVGLLQDFDS